MVRDRRGSRQYFKPPAPLAHVLSRHGSPCRGLCLSCRRLRSLPPRPLLSHRVMLSHLGTTPPPRLYHSCADEPPPRFVSASLAVSLPLPQHAVHESRFLACKPTARFNSRGRAAVVEPPAPLLLNCKPSCARKNQSKMPLTFMQKLVGQ